MSTLRERFAEVEAKMWSMVEKKCPQGDMLLEASAMASTLKVPPGEARSIAVRIFSQNQADLREEQASNGR